MHAIGRRHDLGFSAGDQIVLIDFTNCRVSDRVIAEMQAHFSDAEIRR